VFDRVFLESAFSGLVTDWAIERVIDEKEFHHALTAFFDQFAGGPEAHVFGHGIGTSNHRTGHPTDRDVAVFVVLRVLAGCRAGRHAHLNEAHPAAAGRAQFWMVAIMRDDGSGLFTGLDHPCALGKLVPSAVNLDVDHAFFGRKVFRQFQFRARRNCVAHGIKENAGRGVQLRPAGWRATMSG